MMKYLLVLPLVVSHAFLGAVSFVEGNLVAGAPNSVLADDSIEPPTVFRGTINRKGHGIHSFLLLHTHWNSSDSSHVVKYEIFADGKHIHTVKANKPFRFTHKLDAKRFFLSGLYHLPHKHKFCEACWDEYTKFLHKKYRIRAVNKAGKKSKFTRLSLKK